MACVLRDGTIQRSFTALKPLVSSCPFLPTRSPWQPPIFYCLHSFAVSRMSPSWNRTVCSYFRLASFTQLQALKCPPCLSVASELSSYLWITLQLCLAEGEKIKKLSLNCCYRKEGGAHKEKQVFGLAPNRVNLPALQLLLSLASWRPPIDGFRRMLHVPCWPSLS